MVIKNCTFANNSATNGRAVTSDRNFSPTTSSYFQLTDCILWDGGNEIFKDSYASINVTYSDVQDGYSGTGNINANPLFVSGMKGSYYLSQTAAGQPSNSPCIDAGSDTAVNLGLGDKTTRTDHFYDIGMVDMGYHYTVSINPDLNVDAFVDFFDYAILSLDWQQSPDPCDPNSGDINKSGRVDIYDLARLVEDWLTCFVTEATNPEPIDHAAGLSMYVVLQWSPGEKTTSHDVYFGTDFNEVNDADIDNPSVYMGNQDANFWDSNNYNPNGLDFNTTYYWRIDEVAAGCIAKGNIWTFTVDSGKAGNPQPSDGQINVTSQPTLSWSSGKDAISHNIYFGTSLIEVNDARSHPKTPNKHRLWHG